MSRHRNDPRGGMRIALGSTAVIVALALAVVGGYALFSAMNPAPDRASAAPRPTSAAATSSNPVPEAPSRTVLSITVTGQSAHVFVATPGTGAVLLDRALQHGDKWVSERANLQVVISDGGAVAVTISGRRQPQGRAGQRQTFTINSGVAVGAAQS